MFYSSDLFTVEMITSASKIKILLISSVVPEELSLGSSLTLKRHFDDVRLEWQVFSPTRNTLKSRLYRRLRRGRFREAIRIVESLSPPKHCKSEIDSIICQYNPDVILSIAHGWDYLAAAQAAKRWRIPLIIFCHDWWPDKAEVAHLARFWVARQLRSICRNSHSVLSVSEGMHRELGGLLNSQILYPISEKANNITRKQTGHKQFRVVYFGNLYEYGPMIESAAEACLNSVNVRLEVFGPEPWWKPGMAARFRDSGVYHGLIPRNEFFERIASYDASLVAMSFECKMERRMKTSFPSKLVEMAQLNKPLVIWGPEYCSAVQWARKRKAALCITDPSPEAILHALESLAASRSEQDRLTLAAGDAAANDFNPDFIQEKFISILEKARIDRQKS